MLGVTVNLLDRRRWPSAHLGALAGARPSGGHLRRGRASRLFGSQADLSDPVAAFDRAGNLYVAGIAFDRVKPANGDW